VPRFLSEDEVNAFRERVYAVAERLFDEHGLEAVSMRQLGGNLGVTAMTLYRYFKDKDDILAAVRARGFDRIAATLETALATTSGPTEEAEPVSSAYIAFAFENPAAYRLMFELTQPNEADYPDLARAVSRARLTLRAFADRLIATGRIEGGQPEVVAHAYWAAIHGLVVLRLAGKLSPTVGFDSVWTSLSGALAHGFRPHAGR